MEPERLLQRACDSHEHLVAGVNCLAEIADIGNGGNRFFAEGNPTPPVERGSEWVLLPSEKGTSSQVAVIG